MLSKIISINLTEKNEATNGNYALGNEQFKEEIEKMLGRRVTQEIAGRPKN